MFFVQYFDFLNKKNSSKYFYIDMNVRVLLLILVIVMSDVLIQIPIEVLGIVIRVTVKVSNLLDLVLHVSIKEFMMILENCLIKMTSTFLYAYR